MKLDCDKFCTLRNVGIAGAILIILIVLFCRDSEFSYLSQKADELRNDPDRIIQFVTEEVVYEDYEGGSRGALGTLWGNAGNELDQARLLTDLLTEAEVVSAIHTAEGRYWVVSEGNGNIINPAGQSLESVGGTPLDFIEDLSIKLIVNGNENEAPEFKGQVSAFLRHPLKISVDQTSASLFGKEDLALISTSLDNATRLVCRVTFHLPDGSAKTIRRELFRRKEGSQHQNANHIVTLAPSTISEEVFQKQAELLAKDLNNDELLRAYELTLSHWFRSDQALIDLNQFFSTSAFYAVPRILIGSIYYGDTGSAEGYALDLRENDIYLEADEVTKHSFAVTRSALEGELENKVMEEAFDVPARSAIEVFLNYLGYVSPSSTKRVADYLGNIDNFVFDAYPGEKIRLSIDEDQWIDLVHTETGVAPQLSKELNKVRRRIKLIGNCFIDRKLLLQGKN